VQRGMGKDKLSGGGSKGGGGGGGGGGGSGGTPTLSLEQFADSLVGSGAQKPLGGGDGGGGGGGGGKGNKSKGGGGGRAWQTVLATSQDAIQVKNRWFKVRWITFHLASNIV